MTTLASLEKQIEALKKKADAIRKAEAAAAIKTVRDLIAQYGLTADDVGLGSGRGRSKAKAASAPKQAGQAKYRDPTTGKTWTGHGKPPGWIAKAADRTKFLIEGQASAVAAVTTAPKVRKAAKAAKAPEVKATASDKKALVKKALVKKVAAKKSRALTQKKALPVPTSPEKSGGAAPKANKRAAKKVVPAKSQDMAADSAVASGSGEG